MGWLRCIRNGGILGPASVGLVLWSLATVAWAQTPTQNYIRGTEALEATLAAAEGAVAEAKRQVSPTPEGQYHLEGAERAMALARREFERHDWESALQLAHLALGHAWTARVSARRE